MKLLEFVQNTIIKPTVTVTNANVLDGPGPKGIYCLVPDQFFRRQVLVLFTELAPILIIIFADVLERSNPSLFRGEQTIRAAFQNHCKPFKSGNVGPAGIL